MFTKLVTYLLFKWTYPAKKNQYYKTLAQWLKEFNNNTLQKAHSKQVKDWKTFRDIRYSLK